MTANSISTVNQELVGPGRISEAVELPTPSKVSLLFSYHIISYHIICHFHHLHPTKKKFEKFSKNIFFLLLLLLLLLPLSSSSSFFFFLLLSSSFFFLFFVFLLLSSSSFSFLLFKNSHFHHLRPTKKKFQKFSKNIFFSPPPLIGERKS